MLRSLCIGVLGFLAACGGNDLVLPGEGSPAHLTIVSGNNQSGQAGAPLADPIVVLVTDSRDRPVADVEVAFTFNGGEGTTLVPETAITDADGRTSTQLQLGATLGEVQGRARVTSGSTVLEAPFTAVTVPGAASAMRAISGGDQTAQVGAALPNPLVVEVDDAFGHPIADVTVTWSVTGGGSTSAATTVTGTDGRTSVQRTLGPTAGAQTARASVAGLSGSPVVFTHQATAAPASQVSIVAGNGQTGPVATRLPQDLIVLVRDGSGNAVTGASVAWVVTSGGGAAQSATSTTGSDGRASTGWTLGSTPGTNRLEARVAGIGVATFTATASAGTSVALAMRTQPAGTAVTGVPFGRDPVVELRDGSGNAVRRSGVVVTVAIASGNGTLGGTTTQSTDDNGRARFGDLQINGGSGPHTLIFSAPDHASVTSDAIDVRSPSVATTTTIIADIPDPSVPGEAVTVTFSVTSNAGSPTGTVTVTANGGGESCSAPVAVGSCTLVLIGEGSRTLTASYVGDAPFEASSDTESHDVVPSDSDPGDNPDDGPGDGPGGNNGDDDGPDGNPGPGNPGPEN